MEDFIDSWIPIFSIIALAFVGYITILSIAFFILWALGLDTTILHNFGFYGEQFITTLERQK